MFFLCIFALLLIYRTYMAHKISTKEQILQTATLVFNKNGYVKTSVEEIARLSKKAKGSVYYYYESKEGLFTAVVKNEISLFQQQLQTILNNSEYTIFDQLKHYLILRMQLIQQSPSYLQTLRLAFPQQLSTHQQMGFLNDVKQEFDKWETAQFIKIIQSGIYSKQLNIAIDPLAFADMMTMLLKGLEIQFFTQCKYEHYVHTFNTLVEFLLSYLTNNISAEHETK